MRGTSRAATRVGLMFNLPTECVNRHEITLSRMKTVLVLTIRSGHANKRDSFEMFRRWHSKSPPKTISSSLYSPPIHKMFFSLQLLQLLQLIVQIEL